MWQGFRGAILFHLDPALYNNLERVGGVPRLIMPVGEIRLFQGY